MGGVQTFGTEEVLALRERWRPIPKGAGYAFGLATLLVVVVLMPLAYCAAVGAVGWAVSWQLMENAPRAGGGERAGLLALVRWLGPAAAGLVLIAFLLKPLFAPRPRRDEPYVLTAREEPRLFAFVESVCAVIGAPPPSQIAVDCDVNASAGFRGGWLSMVRRGDMTLTIGMPLVAGMSKREFAGVLAHEFGHFAQASGMRVTYSARAMINWFAHAALERDAWDERLGAMTSRGSFPIVALALGVRACVFVARLVLRLVVYVCFVLCAFMLRRMEFDADRYETQLVGSEAFISTARRLVDLHAGYPKAEDAVVQMCRRDRTVPDNFPALVADAAARVTPEARAEVERRAGAAERGIAAIFSTHPGTAARIAHAQRANEPGLITDDRPARDLFSDFDGACLKATFGHYKSAFGRSFGGVTFVPTAPLLSTPGHAPAARGGLLERYLGFEPPTWRPLLPELIEVPAISDGQRAMERLKRARERVRSSENGVPAQVETFRAASEEMLRWEHARFLLDSGIRPDFRKLGLKTESRSGVSRRIDGLRDRTAEAAAVVDDAADTARDRLHAAISVLGVRGIERVIPDAPARKARANEILAMARALSDTARHAREVRELFGRVEALSQTVRNRKTDEAARKVLRPLSDEIRDRLGDARQIGGGVRYPFGNGTREQNMGERLVGASPAWREYDQILEAAERFVDRWPDECRRALSELVALASGVEKSLARAAKVRADKGRGGESAVAS